MEYAPLTESLSKVVEKSESLLTPDKMLVSLTTEQQRQLLFNLVQQELEYRKKNKENGRVKKLSR